MLPRRLSFRVQLSVIFCALTVCSAAAAAAGMDEAAPRRPFAYEFTVGDLGWKTSGPFTGWTKNFRPNPIPYRMVLSAASLSRPLASRRPLLRNVEMVHSLVWSSITRGPENHWGGVATGFRYHYDLPGPVHTSLFASYQGGVGGIDSSGMKYAQAKDLTFVYLAAVGFRTQITRHFAAHVQVLGQHISNGWQTRPSEGIDCSGWSLVLSYRPLLSR